MEQVNSHHNVHIFSFTIKTIFCVAKFSWVKTLITTVKDGTKYCLLNYVGSNDLNTHNKKVNSSTFTINLVCVHKLIESRF